MTRILSTLYRVKFTILRFRWWWLSLFGETAPRREHVPSSQRIPERTYIECEDMLYVPTWEGYHRPILPQRPYMTLYWEAAERVDRPCTKSEARSLIHSTETHG